MTRQTTPADAARRLNGFAGRMQTIQRDAVSAAALASKTVMVGEYRKVIGSDMRMSGVGRRGRKIGVNFKVEGSTNPQAWVAVNGPAHLVENDTKPHRIPRQRGRRARKRAVVIPGVGVRAFANHPGTTGKHPFAKGRRRAERPAIAAFSRVIGSEFRKTFG